MERQEPVVSDSVERSLLERFAFSTGRPIAAVEREGDRVILGLSHGVREEQLFIRDATDTVSGYDEASWFFITDRVSIDTFAAMHGIDAPSENGYKST